LLLVPPCYRRLLVFILLIQKPQRYACNRLLVGSVVGVKEFLVTVLPCRKRQALVFTASQPRCGPTLTKSRTLIEATSTCRTGQCHSCASCVECHLWCHAIAGMSLDAVADVFAAHLSGFIAWLVCGFITLCIWSLFKAEFWSLSRGRSRI
jgi:hypothetical protein